MDEAETKSLASIWGEAEARFRGLTAYNLNISPPRTFEDVCTEWESLQTLGPSVSNDGNLKQDAKRIGLNVFKCFKLLGAVGAQAATEIFGSPGQLVFNALSFLLDIPRKVHEFHGVINGLFAEVSVMLSQFRILGRIERFTSIDPDLLNTVHKLMISFVDICGITINAQKGGRWKRFKLSAKKVVLDDDSGINNEFKNFKFLIDQQNTIRGTVTLEHVLKSEDHLTTLLRQADEQERRMANVASNVEVLTSAENNRKTEDEKQKQLHTIKERFSFRGDNDQASHDQVSIKTFETNWDQCIANSGAWRHDIQGYINWIKPNAAVHPLLLLSGEASTGKSFLVASIIHELHPSYIQYGYENSIHSPRFGYYFFPPKEKNLGDSGRVEAALKCLSLQLAEQNITYRKRLTTLCAEKDETYFKSCSCKTLWDDLKLGIPSATPNKPTFLILDGLDNLSDGSAEQLLGLLTSISNLGHDDGSQVRVLASGKPETFKGNILQGVPIIEIEKHNGPDIKLYITNWLKDNDLLQEKDQEIVKLKVSIEGGLPRKARGSFFTIQTALKSIRKAMLADASFEQLEDIINEADQDRQQIAEGVVKSLNERLNAKEILELNELLIWVGFAYQWPSVDELKAALYLRFTTTSPLPLEKKLKDKYATILQLQDNDVKIDDDIKNAIAIHDPKRMRTIEDEPRITATITIIKADIKTVQSFAWSLAQKAVMDNFQFDDSSATTETKGTVKVNKFDAHLTIVQQILKLLIHPHEKSNTLIAYASKWLPHHLKVLRDSEMLALLEPAERREIGKSLFTLLTDEDILKSVWVSGASAANAWLTGDSLATFWEWLRDSQAIESLSKKEKQWLSKQKLKPNRNQSLLLQVTRMVAKNWLQRREWGPIGCFLWIRNFLSLPAVSPHVEIAKNGDDEKVLELTENDNIDLGVEEDGQAILIDKAVQWAKAELKIEKLTSCWYERIGQTYFSYWELDAAIKTFKEAIKNCRPCAECGEIKGAIDMELWKCYEGLAAAYGSGFTKEEGNRLATAEMEHALRILRSISDPSPEERHSLFYDLGLLGNWRAELSQPDAAIEAYTEALGGKPESSVTKFKILLTLLTTAGYEDRAREMLRKLINTPQTSSDNSQLQEIFEPMLLNYDASHIFSAIFSATRRTPIFNEFMKELDRAITLAGKDGQHDHFAGLLFFRGVAGYYYDHREELKKTRTTALEYWTKCSDLMPKIGTSGQLQSGVSALMLLGFHHFEQALTSENPSEHVQKMKQYAEVKATTFYSEITIHSLPLVAYYVVQGDFASARKFLLEDMISSLAILSDDILENDRTGYRSLAITLLHAGDELNALSAWSLLRPPFVGVKDKNLLQLGPEAHNGHLSQESNQSSVPESIKITQIQTPIHGAEEHSDKIQAETFTENQQPSEVVPNQDDGGEPFIYGIADCDGHCRKRWTFAEDMYCCKYCADVQFCGSCLPKRINGTLKTFICSPNHQWQYIPKWGKELADVEEGMVKICGKLQDGRRVGGKIVKVEEWFDMLRDEWNIPKGQVDKNKSDEAKAAFVG